MIANRLRLEAQARGGCTIVSRIRGEGLLRASRPFHEGAASRVVVAHLGPGMIRGDAFATGGSVAPGAHLIVAGQMATRVLSGPEPAVHDAVWHVGREGTLDLQPEPVLVGAGTAYLGTTELHLAPGARVRVREIVLCERGASVRTTLTGRRDRRLAFVDALTLEGDADAHAIGTLLFAGIRRSRRTRRARRCVARRARRHRRAARRRRPRTRRGDGRSRGGGGARCAARRAVGGGSVKSFGF